jgi:phospholipid/cholesterol/gamma-HCH transport system substrate-binding protein
VRPTVRALRVAAENLEPVTPRLTKVFKFVNALLNTLAYNPPGEEEGYLFWASWINHAGATVFGTQDAHGPIRRGMVIASCNSLQLLQSVTETNPALDTLFQLLNAPVDACPQPIPPGVPPKTSAKKQAPAAPTPGKPVLKDEVKR